MMDSLVTTSASAAPGISRSCGASTSVAPCRSAMQISDTAASKPREANCRTRLAGPTPNSSAWAADRLGIPRWVTTTPLGRPVEPEV
nr:hypothetical protein [Actinomadura madurae]